jgi:hypothetical protein
MLIVAEYSEVLLHRLVLMLCLPIRLWMEVCREPMVSTHVSTYQCPDWACKLGATICNYVLRDAPLANVRFKAEAGQF